MRAALNATSAVMSWSASGEAVRRVDVGPYPVVLVNDPDAAAAVLEGRADGVCERGRFYDEISRVIGRTSLVTASGAQHRRVRRLVEPAFRPAALRGYAEAMVDVAEETARAWRPGQRLRLDAAMQELTLAVAARTFLGEQLPGSLDDVATVMRAGTKLFYRLLLPARVSDALWRIRWLPANRRLAAAQQRVDATLADVVARRRQDGGCGALIDVLLAQDLTEEELRDQLVTFVFAGHETTAQALTWAFALLAVHPDVRARLREELAERLGDRAATADDVARLPYTRAVFREALRLYPPAWFLSREATRDTVLAGCPVPRRALILVSPLALHRDRRIWRDPRVFRPERWLDGEPDGRERAAYLPFGRGTRSCIGSSFATTEGVLVLSVLARWDMRLLSRVRPRGTTTLRPARAMWVQLG